MIHRCYVVELIGNIIFNSKSEQTLRLYRMNKSLIFIYFLIILYH